MSALSHEYEYLIKELENEIQELQSDLADSKNEIGDLKHELQTLDQDYDDVLANIAKQLGIIIVPNMRQWALLLEIERAIEDVKNSGH